MNTGFVLYKPSIEMKMKFEKLRQKEKHTLRAEIGERARQEENAMFCWETTKPRKTRVVVASSFAY